MFCMELFIHPLSLEVENLQGVFMAKLLHLSFTGANGSTTYTDLTGRHTVANFGSEISNDHASGFGTHLKCKVPVTEVGTANLGYISIAGGGANGADFDFATNANWTYHFWMYGNVGSSTRFWMRYSDTSTYYYVSSGSGYWTNNLTQAGSPALQSNQWNHIALVKSGATYYLFLNGTNVGMGAIFPGGWPADLGARDLWIGSNDSGNAATPLYIDEIILENTALWTAPFTPPTPPVPAPKTIVVSTQGDTLKVSHDGSTFSDASVVGNWHSVSVSRDGTKMVAFNDYNVYTSSDGDTWVDRGTVAGTEGPAEMYTTAACNNAVFASIYAGEGHNGIQKSADLVNFTTFYQSPMTPNFAPFTFYDSIRSMAACSTVLAAGLTAPQGFIVVALKVSDGTADGAGSVSGYPEIAYLDVNDNSFLSCVGISADGKVIAIGGKHTGGGGPSSLIRLVRGETSWAPVATTIAPTIANEGIIHVSVNTDGTKFLLVTDSNKIYVATCSSPSTGLTITQATATFGSTAVRRAGGMTADGGRGLVGQADGSVLYSDNSCASFTSLVPSAFGMDFGGAAMSGMLGQELDPVAQPETTFSPVAGTYNTSQVVEIIAPVAELTYYTTNGDTPTVLSAQYGAPFEVETSLTIKTLSVATGYIDRYGEAAYVIDADAPTVVVATTEVSPTENITFPVTFEFSEAVTGFDETDITVTNGTAGNFAGTGTSYSADITANAAGDVTVQVLSGKCIDGANNGNAISNLITVDYAPQSMISRTTATRGVVYNDVEVVVADVLAIAPVAADLYYSNISNLKKILFTYKNGAQTKVVKFTNNGSDVFPATTVLFTLRALVGTWTLQQITLRDFDGGYLNVSLADIPAGYDMIVS
jgi:hypothetical protein